MASAQRAGPGSLFDKVPGPEGAQYSVARFAGSGIQGEVIPGLRSLTWAIFRRPDVSGLVDADKRVDSLLSWR